MNLEQLVKSGKIIYSVVGGSHAYNLNTPDSDEDIRGIFVHAPKEYLRLSSPVEQVGDNKHDIVYYSLKRFFELAVKANPNIIELLWIDDNLVKVCEPMARKLRENRHKFLSQKVFHTFSGYAYAQIQKAKGQNKMVNHPEMAKRPVKEDYCRIIPMVSIDSKYFDVLNNLFDFIGTDAVAPCRPMPLDRWKQDLKNFHCARLEHTSNIYRLYYYGDTKCKGVFRGDDMLVTESIPLEDETKRFYGFLIYDKNLYEKVLVQHNRYKEWIGKRNNSRWIDQEKGLVKYDAKNMMHCFRLLMSGLNLLKTGEPIVRFEGKDREFLMDIRRGNFEYETLIEKVEKKMSELEEYKDSTFLPHSVNMKEMENLYADLTNGSAWYDMKEICI